MGSNADGARYYRPGASKCPASSRFHLSALASYQHTNPSTSWILHTCIHLDGRPDLIRAGRSRERDLSCCLIYAPRFWKETTPSCSFFVWARGLPTGLLLIMARCSRFSLPGAEDGEPCNLHGGENLLPGGWNQPTVYSWLCEQLFSS